MQEELKRLVGRDENWQMQRVGGIGRLKLRNREKGTSGLRKYTRKGQMPAVWCCSLLIK